MKLFKNPVVAVLLALVLILGSTLLNVHWKFGGLCREVTDGLYAEDGIAAQLETIRVDAAAIASVAERNGIDAKALRNAADDLQSVLSRGSSGAGYLFRCYDKLRVELISMEQKLLAVALNETDANTISGCLERIRSAYSAISSASYNDTVRSFLSRYDHFPTHFLARLAGVDMPEVFA